MSHHAARLHRRSRAHGKATQCTSWSPDGLIHKYQKYSLRDRTSRIQRQSGGGHLPDSPANSQNRGPPELIDAIIDYLHDNQQALRPCTLVCKTWIVRARLHLFSRLEVDNQQDVERLIGTEYVIPFIRHIHITRSQPWQINLLPRIGFGNVQSLTVTEPLSCFMDDPILSILCNTFSSVVTLRVQVGTLAYDNSADLVRFICAFSHLRMPCVFGNISVDLSRPTSSSLSTHLCHLVLDGGGGATRLLEWFILHPDRPALRTLDLESADEADFNAIVGARSLLEIPWNHSPSCCIGIVMAVRSLSLLSTA